MEWNRRNIIALVVILVLGFGSGGVIYVSEEGGMSFAIFRLKRWANGLYGATPPALTASELARAEKRADEVVGKELARYPELQIKPKPVVDALNGFLAILVTKDDLRFLDLKNSEITSKVDQETINAADVQRELDIHKEIGAEIERIASLPERSSENLPISFEWLFPSREFKTMADYLRLKARLAAMRKDEREALRYIELAVNLSEHLNEIERPSLLSETLRILARNGARESMMSHILPELGKDADIEKWRSLLNSRIANGDRISSLIITEIHFFHKDFSRVLFREGSDAVPDPEAFCKAYVAYTDAVVKEYRGVDLPKLLAINLPAFASFGKNLSRESLQVKDEMSDGFLNWIAGYVSNSVAEAHYDAAMDLLVREKAGEDLLKLSETYVHNPYTGKPFPYDAVKRLLPQDTAGYYESNDVKLPW